MPPVRDHETMLAALEDAGLSSPVFDWMGDVLAVLGTLGEPKGRRALGSGGRVHLKKWAESNLDSFYLKVVPAALDLWKEAERRLDPPESPEPDPEWGAFEEDVRYVRDHLDSPGADETPRQVWLRQWAREQPHEFFVNLLPSVEKGLFSPASLADEQKTYFIRHGDHVKIGRSKQVHKRIKALQTGAPDDLSVIAVVDVAERLIHRRFAHLRTRGEWFQWCPEIEGFVEELQTDYEE